MRFSRISSVLRWQLGAAIHKLQEQGQVKHPWKVSGVPGGSHRVCPALWTAGFAKGRAPDTQCVPGGAAYFPFSSPWGWGRNWIWMLAAAPLQLSRPKAVDCKIISYFTGMPECATARPSLQSALLATACRNQASSYPNVFGIALCYRLLWERSSLTWEL